MCKSASSVALAFALLLAACGGDVARGPTAGPPRPRPGPIIEQHPECRGSTEIGPLISLGCRPHCLPPARPRMLCTDVLRLAEFAETEPVPSFIATRDRSDPSCPDGWRIETVSDAKKYTTTNFTWAQHPPPTDQHCDPKLPLDWGYFGRPHSAVWATAREFVPNE